MSQSQNTDTRSIFQIFAKVLKNMRFRWVPPPPTQVATTPFTPKFDSLSIPQGGVVILLLLLKWPQRVTPRLAAAIWWQKQAF